MGIISAVTVQYPMPADVQDKTFSISNGAYEEYTITEDGRLVDHQLSLGYDDEQAAINKREHPDGGVLALMGILKPTYDGDVVVGDIHGDWEIWCRDDAKQVRRFQVRWTNGRVQYIREIEEG